MAKGQPASRSWYVRREGAMRGPLPQGQVLREILLGRIRDGDELSPDRAAWREMAELPQLHPPVLRHADTPEGRRQVILARLREDERRQERRRASFATEGSDRRHGDRRHVESFDVVTRGGAVAHASPESSAEERNLLLPAAVVLTVALMLAMYFLWYEPQPSAASVRCQAAAASGVDWHGCSFTARDLRGASLPGAQLQGSILASAVLRDANLASADLSDANLNDCDARAANLQTATLKGATLLGAKLANADLRDADLTDVDLRGADLSNAQLDGARLDRAIWSDGRVCADQSVGRCRAPD
jgi:uncharacterized protein YjbI with pentapeptide repeats